MPIETVHAHWVRGQEFILRDHFDFPIVMTQPMGVSGADLLPLSIIGCSAWDIIAILKKQKQSVTGFSVSAESERDDEPPWRFKTIKITYHLSGENLDAARVQRAIDLTEGKYCSTFATLRQVVGIESSFVIHPAVASEAETSGENHRSKRNRGGG